MFKLICLAVVAGAFAADTTAPVISLDFVGAFTDGTDANPHSSAVTSSAHFADECQGPAVGKGAKRREGGEEKGRKEEHAHAERARTYYLLGIDYSPTMHSL